MHASESPFPPAWWGTDLEAVSLGSVRPILGTYGRYRFDDLPAVPLELDGELGWLERAPRHKDHIGEKMAKKNAAAIVPLREAVKRKRLKLPPAFVKFMATPALHRRIRSNTDCFLDLGSPPVASPVGNGHLVRFLCDSQGCIFWYLFLTKNGSDHAVVASTDFYGTEEELQAASNWVSDGPDPEALVFCGESFEEFLGRFWLENEIWFAGCDKTPMPPGGAEYIERYRQKTAINGRPKPDTTGWKTPAAFFPWRHVSEYIYRITAESYKKIETERPTFEKKAKGCPECGSAPADLFWMRIISPEPTWRAGEGQVGFLTLCERCHRQVGLFLESELTEMVGNAFREYGMLP